MKRKPNKNQMDASDITSDVRKSSLSEGAQNWSKDYGNPDYDYLKALANKNSEAAIAELKSIADDHNVEYDGADITAQELVDKIFMSVQKDAGDNSM